MTLLAVLLAAAPVVHVEVAASCSGIDATEVRRVVNIELRLTGDRETAFATAVHVACDGPLVHLDVADPVSRKDLQRTMDLSAVAAVARARTLALAVVELVTASWSELALNADPQVEPLGDRPPAAERDAASERALRRPSLRVLLEGTGQALLGSPLRLWGGGLRVAVEPSRLLGVELDVHVDHGTAALALGSVMADRAAAGLSASVRTRFENVGLKALLGVRAGAVRLTGEPNPGARAGSGVGPWVGAHLGGAATVQLGAACAELGVEVGAPLAGIVGYVDGIPAVPFNNFWLGARLSVGIELWSRFPTSPPPSSTMTLLRWMGAALVAGCTCGKVDVLDDGGSGGGTSANGGGVSATGGSGVTGGGGGGGGSTACIPGATGITISPMTSTASVSAQPSPLDFTATVQPSGMDVTSRLTWTSTRGDDTPPGGFSAPGLYQPYAGAGGVVTISATDGCVTGSTTVTLSLSATFNDPGSTVTSRFSGAPMTSGAKVPAWVYPSDQTRFPRNLYKVLFQWKKSGNDYFRLTFTGPGSTTIVYSDGNDPQCAAMASINGCAETDLPTWLAIAGSNAGETVMLTVDGVTTNDANVYRSAAITLGFSKRDVKGAIFYWSTTAQGIRRASVSDADPEDYIVAKPTATVLPDAGSVQCVACHTVSRSGRKIVAHTETGPTMGMPMMMMMMGLKGEFVYDVTPQPPPTPLITTQITDQNGFGTFRPDDARVVATVGMGMQEFDLTGARISTLPIAKGTNPDWSPTGAQLAYSDQPGDSPGMANLAVIAYDNETWGTARTLVPAAGLSNLFPNYSPDGAFIAYARGKGGHGDKSLQLWLVQADGGSPPVELITANRVVNSVVTDGQHENNMPTWAPPGDLQWIAFNSVRPYGVVFPTGGTQQIWVAAIDPSKLGQRGSDGGLVDPSFPGFRFAFQGLTENNHRAFWTLDVRDDAGTAPTCSGLGAVCAQQAQCCLGLVCQNGTQGFETCQVPLSDAGQCLQSGDPCNQTSGASCCQGFCDVGTDGGTVCITIE